MRRKRSNVPDRGRGERLQAEGEDGRPCIKWRRKRNTNPAGEGREIVENTREKAETKNHQDMETILLTLTRLRYWSFLEAKPGERLRKQTRGDVSSVQWRMRISPAIPEKLKARHRNKGGPGVLCRGRFERRRRRRGEKMHPTSNKGGVEECEAKCTQLSQNTKKGTRSRLDSELENRTRTRYTETFRGRMEGWCRKIYQQTRR